MISKPSLVNKTVRVQSIRCQNPQGYGGAIFSGVAVDCQGNINDAKEIIVIKAPYALINGILIEKGQWWEVSGESEVYINEVNGYSLRELQIIPQQMQLIRPSGEHIVRLITENRAFQGVGEVKARQLWERFGDDLYIILDNADISKLSQVISTKVAHHIIDAWQQYGNTKTLQWFVQNGITVAIGKKLLAFYGRETSAKIEKDPYRLLSFHGSWKAVDTIATDIFGIKQDDPRRLQGAIEEILYCRFSSGDTAVPLKSMLSALQRLLKTNDHNWTIIIQKALKEGLGKGCFVIRDNGADLVLHGLGPYIMEKTIAKEVTNRIQEEKNTRNTGFINQQLNNFEEKSGFSLNAEQRLAVTLTTSNSFAIITGGAGTGKTAVLKALYQVYDKLGITIYQMALSGRAAKRMIEATDRKATTIAGFLHRVKTSFFNENTVVVIDEASMINVGTMYRILKLIPPKTKIVLVGDPCQLPPIGAGLVLHCLLDAKEVPKTELKIVNRHGGSIAKAATSIREGRWPELSNNLSKDICFIPCLSSELNEETLSLYTKFLKEKTDVQILEPIKSGKFFGTKHTNKFCQERFANNAQQIKVLNREFNQLEVLSIREGEPVICIKNHWDKELQNGSPGKVLNVYTEPKEQFNDKGDSIGIAYADIEWDDGIVRPLSEDMVDDVILAYSITVHKAQGSQWDTVIIPVYKSRNLDRSMLYTAMTRAQKKVIFIGCIDEAKRIVQEMPKALKRQTGLLDFILEA